MPDANAFEEAIHSGFSAVNEQIGGLVESDGFLDLMTNFTPFISWFAVILLVFLGVRAIVKVARMLVK